MVEIACIQTFLQKYNAFSAMFLYVTVFVVNNAFEAWYLKVKSKFSHGDHKPCFYYISKLSFALC